MDLVGVGGIVSSIASVVDDLWVSDEEKMLAGAAQTNANAQLVAAQGQAQANSDKAALDAANSKKQWETIQYALIGVAVLVVLVLGYQALQG
jgi:uncharacterized membrane protein YukC